MHFVLSLSRQQRQQLTHALKQPGGDAKLLKVLHLETSHNLRNAHAFNEAGDLKFFESPHEIIVLHAQERLAAYGRRKAHELGRLSADLELLRARVRFITMVLDGKLPLLKRTAAEELVDALKTSGFKPYLELKARGGVVASEASEEEHDGLSTEAVNARGNTTVTLAVKTDTNAYSYLLRMPMLSLTGERAAKLEAELARKQDELDELQRTSELEMWKRELHALRAPLKAHLKALESHDGDRRL